MNLRTIQENQFIFFSWVTAIGLFLSLIEASIKIKLENYSNLKKREKRIKNLYPKNLA